MRGVLASITTLLGLLLLPFVASTCPSLKTKIWDVAVVIAGAYEFFVIEIKVPLKSSDEVSKQK